jgi:hypothetical protein
LVLDHEFKEDEKWGETPTIPSQFDEVGDYTRRISLKHQSYYKRQDGDSNDDVIDQCIIATHTTSSVYEYDGNMFFDAYNAEILDAPVSSQDIVPRATVKREPDFKDYGPYSVGCLLTSFRKHSNIWPSMHVFLWELSLRKLLGLLTLPSIYINK